MTSPRREIEDIIARLLKEPPPMIVGPRRGPMMIDKHTVIIGTSGSLDYLNDTTGDRRFWPVSVVSDRPSADDKEGCDGLHDESAPTQYLCSRCFPLRGDLSDSHDYEYDDARRDESEEME